MRKPILNQRAIELHQRDLYSLQMIADFFGVTRQAVKKYLNKHGINTSKSATIQTVTCSQCGQKHPKARCYARKTKNHYCTLECYHKSLHNPDYIPSRQGQRIARDTIRTFYPLAETDIVHHENGNTLINDIDNLMVFRSQSDHIRWHRCGGPDSGVIPLFDGSGKHPCK